MPRNGLHRGAEASTFATMKTTCLIAALLLVSGCAKDDAGTPDAVGDVTDSTDGEVTDTRDSADVGDGVVQLDEPILERAPTGAATCTVERAIAPIADADYQIESLLSVGSAVVATRAYPILEIARAGSDGLFGEAEVLDATQYAASQSASAFDGTSVAVVWTRQDEGGGVTVWFAKVAADDLAVEVAPKELPIGNASYLTQPVIVARSGGWAILYAETLASGTALRLTRLTGDGAVDGATVTVAEGGAANIGFAHSFIATEDGGFAATFALGGYDNAEVSFVRLDAQGAKVSGPHLISRAGGGGYSSGASYRAAGDGLLEHEGKFYAAFTESYSTGDFPDQNTAVIGRLAVVDGAGNGELHKLQASVDDMTTVQPSLHLIDDNIGILWSYGAVIYICGGCITDYDMHFVLLDPATLTPVAPEVEQLSDRNGFTNPRGAVIDGVIGGALFTTTALDFHALSYPATGVFACTPK